MHEFVKPDPREEKSTMIEALNKICPCELGKSDLHKEKSVMAKAQGKMCSGCISQENLTRVKRNLSW